jgi:creatinine amidohydrolase/Fe(II)-dependent formamide hydrolase-like protein
MQANDAGKYFQLMQYNFPRLKDFNVFPAMERGSHGGHGSREATSLLLHLGLEKVDLQRAMQRKK